MAETEENPQIDETRLQAIRRRIEEVAGDAPQLAKLALEQMVTKHNPDLKGTAGSAGRVGAQSGNVSELTAIANLKPGGADEDVTADNLGEYLQLFARFKLVGAIDAQVGAFREGLSCFVDAELRAKLRALCTVAEIQLLLCGVADIDVEDWRASARYEPPAFGTSEQVQWLWAAVGAHTARCGVAE